MTKLSFIIVNYRTKDLLEKCVTNLLNVYENKEIIVVDNDSKDGSAEMIKETFGKKVILIEAENNGISAGYNLGLEKATGDYYVYLGTDAFPDKLSIQELLDFMEDPKHNKVGICTPKLVLRDGSIDWDAHRGLISPWSSFCYFSGLSKVFSKSKFFNQYFLGYKDFSKPHEIDVCISHFMFMRKEVIEKMGKWDENFWVYGEDLDTCYRAQKAGYKIMYVSNVEVLHFKGATVGRKTSADVKANLSSSIKSRLSKGSVIAMELFYKKHLVKKYPIIVNLTVFLGISLMKKMRVLLGK